MPGDGPDSALRALIDVLERSAAHFTSVAERGREVERLVEQGYSWREVLATEERPTLTELLYRNMALINEAAGRLRREEARSLQRDGAKREEIASLLAVSADLVDAMLAGGET